MKSASMLPSRGKEKDQGVINIAQPRRTLPTALEFQLVLVIARFVSLHRRTGPRKLTSSLKLEPEAPRPYHSQRI